MNPAQDLSARVAAALEFEQRVNLHRYPIQITVDGGALTLKGHVESVPAKRIAAQIATQLAAADGRAVADALDVVPPDSRGDGDILDAFTRTMLESPEFKPFTMRRRHRDALETLRSMDGAALPGEVEFGVTEGVIQLAGTVPSLSHRRVAEALAWWVSGCRNVVNGLRVEPAERDGDDEIADAVGLVLEIDPTLPESQPIGVDAVQGVVTLTGSLRDDGQRRRAEYDAWCVEGVRDVRNAIQIPA